MSIEAQMILERAVNYAGQVHVSPLQVLAWLSGSTPQTAKVPLPPGHGDALAAVHAVSGVNLWLWWGKGRSQLELVELFEEALFRVQLG